LVEREVEMLKQRGIRIGHGEMSIRKLYAGHELGRLLKP
jgi:hypothetical protein